MHTSSPPFLTLLVVTALAGCTFADGQPWGEIEGRAAARSIDASGALPDEMDLDRATLSVEIFLESVTTSEGGSGGSLDPSNPPPGYTLCHNGHCHSEDGELVPYDEVEAELNAGGGTSTTTLGSWKTTIDLLSGQPVDLPAVAVDRRTSVERVRLKATNLVLEGTVEVDDATVPLEAQLGQIDLGTLEGLGLPVGPDEPFRQTLAICTSWSNAWFDAIDLSQLERQEGTIRLTRILNSDATATLIGAARDAQIERSTCQ